MKATTLQAAVGSAILLLAAQPGTASAGHQHQHRHLHQQHHQHHVGKKDGLGLSNATINTRYEARRSEKLQPRGGAKCEFPSDKGLFAVTPSALNGGWALAPDQECADGTWCPIACPPGKVMAQWKPNTHYTYPDSTCGGIYCDGGEIKVPFEDKPWCVDGTGAVTAVNKAGDVVSFCQTVLPGYEDMIIPTDVIDTATLAVPDPSYWDSTAAHFYINAPGVSAADGCHWGDDTKPIGNWAPYVAGANTDGSGNTFVKLGVNPVFQDSALYDTKPTFGLKIECDGDCNGLPCEIDGSGVVSDEKATGAGGSDFCVVTVAKGGKANIVVYNLDGSQGSDDTPSTSSSQPTSTSISTTTPSPTPTTTSTPTSTPVPSTTSTSSSILTTSSDVPTTTSSSHSSSITSSSSSDSGSTTITATSRSISSSSAGSSSTSAAFFGAVYHQNGTSSAEYLWTSPTSAPPLAAVTTGTTGESESSPTESSQSENAGQRQGSAAIAGFVVAFVAAVYLL
ncbi:beta-glucosidase-domain-containing protein [Xylariaceae sp. FL1651]|nr:beta-glucosidase-domain-containing protein [Xylariaceae sp. FL1651]